MNNDEQLRYPIGKFSPQPSYMPGEIANNINRIEALPPKLESLLGAFSPKQLDTVYREGGWTARQVVHHLSDSHMNAYVRFKWTLTENIPLIKAYNEKLWAETPEVTLDPTLSVNLLKALHPKWVSLLRQLNPDDLERAFTHPETNKQVPLNRMVALYAWHGEHHLGHLAIISTK